MNMPTKKEMDHFLAFIGSNVHPQTHIFIEDKIKFSLSLSDEERQRGYSADYHEYLDSVTSEHIINMPRENHFFHLVPDSSHISLGATIILKNQGFEPHVIIETVEDTPKGYEFCAVTESYYDTLTEIYLEDIDQKQLKWSNYSDIVFSLSEILSRPQRIEEYLNQRNRFMDKIERLSQL